MYIYFLILNLAAQSSGEASRWHLGRETGGDCCRDLSLDPASTSNLLRGPSEEEARLMLGKGVSPKDVYGLIAAQPHRHTVLQFNGRVCERGSMHRETRGYLAHPLYSR